MSEAINTNVDLLARELTLKNDQMETILAVTRGINSNMKVPRLIELYRDTLGKDKSIPKVALFLKGEGGEWNLSTTKGIDESDFDVSTVIPQLSQFTKLKNLSEEEDSFFKEFNIVMPVLHKKEPLAYAFIGGLEENVPLYEKVNFITTLTNIIAVAIENKRLFKRQLEQDKFQRELNLAKEVQVMFLPDESKMPNNEHFELSSVYLPIFGVGGDFYDYVHDQKEGKLAFCIADISGKGISAALMMANFHAAFNIIYKQSSSLEECVRMLNKAVLEGAKKERFITFFIAEYDVKTRKLEYINAGHNPPVLICGEDTYELDKGCTILGAFDELPSLEKGSLELCDSAIIMNYTDGLTDIVNSKGDFFDSDLLAQFIKRYKEFGAKAINESLLLELVDYKGERDFPDDIAIFTCKIH